MENCTTLFILTNNGMKELVVYFLSICQVFDGKKTHRKYLTRSIIRTLKNDFN